VHIERKSPWIIALRRGVPRRRVFCFTYAGGGASVYRRLTEQMPADVETCTVQLPGREDRYSEPACVSLEALVPALAAEVGRTLDLPFAFFGHSMGALLAFEVTRELRRTGMPQPARLHVSGRRAPHLPSRRRPLHALPDAALDAELRAFGGTPAAVLENPELMDLVRPVLRADFQLCETYVLQTGEPLDVPLVALGGAEDPEARRDELEAWAEHTRAPFRLRIFPGRHFYLHEQWPAMAEDIAGELPAVT
jgi:medium-chain acyl-[acyl-carrier-protein] hydrolase